MCFVFAPAILRAVVQDERTFPKPNEVSLLVDSRFFRKKAQGGCSWIGWFLLIALVGGIASIAKALSYV
jgi:hypothetical protein